MKNDCFKHAMYYGVFLSSLYIILFMLSTTQNIAAIFFSYIIIIAIPMAATYLAIDCRKKINENKFTYLQSLRYQMQLYMYAIFICTAFIFVYVNWINLNFLPNMENQTLTLLDSLSEISNSFQIMEEQRNIKITPKMFTFASFSVYIVIAFFLSLTSSFFVKKS